MIQHIFCELLPREGMSQRPAQIELCHHMLDAMQGGQIALCDAGTGIGKTYAYLTAGIAYQFYRKDTDRVLMPILISTSSIALQTAIQNEYLQLLSKVLLEDGMIQAPISSVIRKGKAHYVCDQRLEQRLRQIKNSNKNAASREAISRLAACFDLDAVEHLSSYDKERVCVPELCICKRQECRYRSFLEQSSRKRPMFLICNHNLLLANAIHCADKKAPIFPDYCALIMDESHKLPEAARQMFGACLTARDLKNLITDLRQQKYYLAADYLRDASHPLMLRLETDRDDAPEFSSYEAQLAVVYETLTMLRYQMLSQLPPLSRCMFSKVLEKIRLLLCGAENKMLCYTETAEDGGTALSCTASDLTAELRRVLWNNRIGMVLTSGTLAVGTDFSRFRTETGIPNSARIVESVTASPFDYSTHCLLYLPQYPPVCQENNMERYYDNLTEEIAALLDAAHGHALVLFTAYSAMAAVSDRLREMPLWFRIYTMGRDATRSAMEFRQQSGGVLLATGSVWEGIDFPGDCVSLLVIPRLPFPIPDTWKELQREQYPSLKEFIQEAVVPEMQIKLRQGFGRAIRTETDACVVAILDSRAGKGKKYYAAMLAALPEVPITSKLEDVERFIWAHKPDQYFKENGA